MNHSTQFPPARSHTGRVSLWRQLVRWRAAAVDLIFPPSCVRCGRVGEAWCADCFADLDATPMLLHRLTVAMEQGTIRVVSTGRHNGILQYAVQALKYHHATDLAVPLADRLTTSLSTLRWSPDMIVPVPMYARRQRQRGYNQAELIAAALADRTDIPHSTNALQRHRDTRSQVGLSRDARRDNLRDAFVANGALVAGRTVLIVDDVTTTGSTLAECAVALRAAGSRAVAGLTITHA